MIRSSKTEMFFAVLLVFFSVLSECATTEPFKPAPNCARFECPAYTVVHTDKDFEIRSYIQARWVYGPEIHSQSYIEAATLGYKILSDYFNGNNKQQVKINMTAPVAVGIHNSTYQVYFYLPKMFQKSTPVPLTSDIHRFTLPQTRYTAVRRFSGYIDNQTIPKELAALKTSLKGTPYEKAINYNKVFTVNGYNSPFELTNRVNEVFLAFN